MYRIDCFGMILFRNILRSLLLLAPALFFVACESATGPVSFDIPLGRYARVEETILGGVHQRRVRSILLTSQQTGWVYDSLWTDRGTGLTLDSTTETTLRFQLTGDGYQRTLEVRSSGTEVDSAYRYWFFFKRNDSLYYYLGDRLLGHGGTLVGRWESDVRDSALNGGRYAMTFAADSVTITGNYGGSGAINGVYGYHADGRTLTIGGVPMGLPTRYEVVPALALYLTTSATGGFGPVH